MRVQISRREVFNNIIRFKDSLHERRSERKWSEKEGRTYPVLLNRKTGDIRFTQKIESVENKIGKKGMAPAEDWREIEIEVRDKNGKVHFEARDPVHHPLKPEGLEPLAYRIIIETLDALNRIAEVHKTPQGVPFPEEAILQDLSQVHIAPLASRIDDLPGWLGTVSRLDAEKMLINRPVGTYLLRHGEEATKRITFHLSQENQIEVIPYLCTVIEIREKISDILFLQTDWGWTLYLDNPNLSMPFYIYHPNPQNLLLEVKHRAKHPLH